MQGIWIRKHNQRGFSLLEIMVSLFLLSTAFVAVSQLHKQNLDQQYEATFLTTAQFLAQDLVSRVRALPSLEPGTTSGDFHGYGFSYVYQREVEEISDIDGLYRVTLSIGQEEGGRGPDYTVATYVFRRSR